MARASALGGHSRSWGNPPCSGPWGVDLSSDRAATSTYKRTCRLIRRPILRSECYVFLERGHTTPPLIPVTTHPAGRQQHGHRPMGVARLHVGGRKHTTRVFARQMSECGTLFFLLESLEKVSTHPSREVIISPDGFLAFPRRERKWQVIKGSPPRVPHPSVAGGCSRHLIHQGLFFLPEPHTQTCLANGEREREEVILHLSQTRIFVLVNFPNKLWSCLTAPSVEFL